MFLIKGSTVVVSTSAVPERVEDRSFLEEEEEEETWTHPDLRANRYYSDPALGSGGESALSILEIDLYQGFRVTRLLEGGRLESHAEEALLPSALPGSTMHWVFIRYAPRAILSKSYWWEHLWSLRKYPAIAVAWRWVLHWQSSGMRPAEWPFSSNQFLHHKKIFTHGE